MPFLYGDRGLTTTTIILYRHSAIIVILECSDAAVKIESSDVELLD